MNIRKNQRDLPPEEKRRFINAVLALKNSTPSQRGLSNRYDDYVMIHQESMSGMTSTYPGWAHQGPAFLPWHRVFLRRLELDLQAADRSLGNDGNIALPYWDWTLDNLPDSSIWGADFMGGNGRDGDGRVMDGPFAFDSSNWTLNIHDPGNPNPGPDLRRRFGTFPNVTQLPTVTQVEQTLAETRYYVAPWRAFEDLFTQAGVAQPSFCNRLEGWYGAGSIHNRVHLWVAGGTPPQFANAGAMFWGTSPNDPVFFLHHCNIDRLWAEWQRRTQSLQYQPSGVGSEVGPTGHNLNDPMQPWGGDATPANALAHSPLGYQYDTEPVIDDLAPSHVALVINNLREHVPAPIRMDSTAGHGHGHGHGHPVPMFGLSAEDKASGEEGGTNTVPPSTGGTSTPPHDARPDSEGHHLPMFGLSAEDKADGGEIY